MFIFKVAEILVIILLGYIECSKKTIQEPEYILLIENAIWYESVKSDL